MAEKLQQALSRLEDANAQLERDVEKGRLLLAERKELVDSLSHEMKTPLGIIRAYAEGLQDESDEAKKQKYAQVIVSEVERMNDLIVTLLDLSALLLFRWNCQSRPSGNVMYPPANRQTTGKGLDFP